MNPGIVRTVAILQASGFNTVDSGDGETHDFECDRDHAYVAMTVAPEKMVEETHRLRDLLATYGVEIKPLGEDEEPCIQASYDPAQGSAIIDLMYVSDKMLKELPC